MLYGAVCRMEEKKDVGKKERQRRRERDDRY